jgi:Fis family transcriptional regulator, factor for inversion stimulation protein
VASTMTHRLQGVRGRSAKRSGAALHISQMNGAAHASGHASTHSSTHAPSHQAIRGKQRPLRDMTEEALGKYFKDLNGHRPGDLYELVLGEVEEPLFRTVMDYTRGNQSVAAAILGINRATLRKKLRHYRLLD